jgi:hypothetical protein
MSSGRISYDGKPAELAKLAEGKTWEIHVAAGERVDLPKESKVVDQVPEVAGGMRMRVLSPTCPHVAAKPIEPVIEDGYLQLVTRSAG